MPRRLFALILLSLTLFFSIPSFVLAQDNYGLDSTAGAAGIPTSKNITTILGDVIGTALSLVSVLFFGLMLYAGIKWMLARGDEGESTKALDTIVAAIIGLVIVLASYAITTFVFKSVGGGGTTDTGPDNSLQKSECEVNYGALGYSCNEKSACNKTVNAEVDWDNVGKGTFKDGAETKYYISGQCPKTPICCKKQ